MNWLASSQQRFVNAQAPIQRTASSWYAFPSRTKILLAYIMTCSIAFAVWTLPFLVPWTLWGPEMLWCIPLMQKNGLFLGRHDFGSGRSAWIIIAGNKAIRPGNVNTKISRKAEDSSVSSRKIDDRLSFQLFMLGNSASKMPNSEPLILSQEVAYGSRAAGWGTPALYLCYEYTYTVHYITCRIGEYETRISNLCQLVSKLVVFFIITRAEKGLLSPYLRASRLRL